MRVCSPTSWVLALPPTHLSHASEPIACNIVPLDTGWSPLLDYCWISPGPSCHTPPIWVSSDLLHLTSYTGELLLAMQVDSPASYKAFLASHRPKHIDPDGSDYETHAQQPAWRCVEHLLSLIVRTVILNLTEAPPSYTTSRTTSRTTAAASGSGGVGSSSADAAGAGAAGAGAAGAGAAGAGAAGAGAGGGAPSSILGAGGGATQRVQTGAKQRVDAAAALLFLRRRSQGKPLHRPLASLGDVDFEECIENAASRAIRMISATKIQMMYWLRNARRRVSARKSQQSTADDEAK